MKAMIVNKIGDFGLSLGIALIFFVFQTFDFSINRINSISDQSKKSSTVSRVTS